MGLFDENQVCPTDVIRLKDLVPPYYFEDDGTTARFYEVFEGVYCQITNDIGNVQNIYNIDTTDERFIDLILKHLGFDLNVYLPLERKRKLAKVIMKAYQQKGTCPGIENVIRQFTGVESECFPFTQGWILGISELGFDTYLNPSPSTPAEYYKFDVIVHQKLSTDQRNIILQLIELMRPAYTHFNELIEDAEDPFVTSIRKMMNRGSLHLYRAQNTDGGWDALDDDGNTLNVSARENVGEHGLGEVFAFAFTELPRVEETAQDAASYLVNDVVYSFSGNLPEVADISLLNRGVLLGVVGASAQRDAALEALREFMKAIAFLNNFAATSAEIAATTIGERNSTTQTKRAQFLYLHQTGVYGFANGIYRYVKYLLDFVEVGDDTFAELMAAELNLRTSTFNLAVDFGNKTLKTNGAIVLGLQSFNAGLVYEGRISSATAVIDSKFDVGDQLYVDTFLGTGRMDEQAVILDAWMKRARYGQAKQLLNGIRLKQYVNGAFDDPIDVGTERLRSVGVIMDTAGRAIKRINEEGL